MVEIWSAHFYASIILFFISLVLVALDNILATNTVRVKKKCPYFSVVQGIVQCFPSSRSISQIFINAAISSKPKKLQTRDTHFWNQQVFMSGY